MLLLYLYACKIIMYKNKSYELLTKNIILAPMATISKILHSYKYNVGACRQLVTWWLQIVIHKTIAFLWLMRDIGLIFCFWSACRSIFSEFPDIHNHAFVLNTAVLHSVASSIQAHCLGAQVSAFCTLVPRAHPRWCILSLYTISFPLWLPKIKEGKKESLVTWQF